jgi:hypothetical protein
LLQTIEHALALHEATPLMLLHAAPHAPQCTGLLVVLVSHPLLPTPSQLPQPALHPGVQTPARHEVLPLGFEHDVAQLPQWFTSEPSVASQPLFGFASQLPNPPLHVGTHCPEVQTVVPLSFEHAVPHAPQLAALLCVLDSHPLLGLPSQLANPGAQVGTQAPPLHVVAPLAFEHATAHVPQCATVSSCASQPFSCALPSQLPQPDVQLIPHTPAAQDGEPLVLLHTVPQAPQLPVLLLRSVSQPFASLPSQLPQPWLHEEIWQLPVAHVAVALARLHGAPHVPQLVSELSWVSQPFASLPSQLPQPWLQLEQPQTPATQLGAPLVHVHVLPQLPQ